MQNPEIRRTSHAEIDPGVKGLVGFIAETSRALRDEGIPIGDDGRVDMHAYRLFYGKAAEADLANSSDILSPDRLVTDGEKLEILALAILRKNLGADFFVARSAPHDDKVHHVDTVIFDRRTGALVCAFDEVSAMSGADYEKKQAIITKQNVDGGGANLKYGFRLEVNDDRKRIVPDEVAHVPLFYIALPKDRIEKGIREFTLDPVRQSDFESKLFTYFVSAIALQIQAIKLYERRLNPEFARRLQDFSKVIELFRGK